VDRVPRPRLCVGVRIRLTFEDTPTQSRGRGTHPFDVDGLAGWDKAPISENTVAAGPPSSSVAKKRRWVGVRKASLVPPYAVFLQGPPGSPRAVQANVGRAASLPDLGPQAKARRGEEGSSRRSAQKPRRQHGGLLHPRRYLRLIERIVFMDVEVAHFLLLGLAGRERAQ